MKKFLPMNELESSLLAVKHDEIPVSEFIRQLVSSDLALPTAKEVQEDGSGFEPIFFEKQGTRMLAVFTDKARASQLTHVAKYCLVMNGLEVLRRMPPENGIVVNPGLKVGFELSREGIAQIVDCDW